MSVSEPWTIRRGNLACLPVCHYRLEYAELVRAQFAKDPPDCLALELPSHLAEAYERAISRLPEVSILLFEDASKQTVYLPVEPADPFAEAARSALEMGSIRYDDSGEGRNAQFKIRLIKGRKYVLRIRLYYKHAAGETAVMMI